jgi:6-pyruvoyltetrahydropterin/6-carboxytetrahydropterin synthase
MKSYITIDGWRSNIRFSCAHIIHEYEKCGRLHGHTYAIHAKITGKPDEKGIIIDFSQLKEILREIANELDHHVLIPEESRISEIKKEEKFVEIQALKKRYLFPYEDCVFLPIRSTSAENLSKYILKQLIDRIKLPKGIKNVEVGVDEGYGQGAKISKDLK